jgi:hypothetical protein
MDVAAQNAALNFVDSPDPKRQRHSPFCESPEPIPVKWTLPCKEFIRVSEAGKGLKDARDLAEQWSPKRRPCASPDKYRERVALLTRKIRKTSVFLAKSLIDRAYKRLTTMPPAMYVDDVSTGLSFSQEDILDLVARWQLFMIWYGVGSPEERSMCFFLCQWCSSAVKDVPLCMENIVVAMCFNLAVTENRVGGGDAVMFAPVESRNFLTKDSKLLEDALSVYCLLETSGDGSMYHLVDSYLRDDLDLNLHLICMAGDDMLCYIDEDLYDSALLSTWVQQARNAHYQRNPEREPWLRIIKTTPLLKFGSTIQEWDAYAMM